MNSVSDELEELYRSRYLAFRNGMAAITGSYESARDVVQRRSRGRFGIAISIGATDR